MSDSEHPRPLDTPIGSAEPKADPDHPSGQPPETPPSTDTPHPTGEEQAEQNRADESPA